MCGCKCCISSNIMHSYLVTWWDCHLRQLKYRSHNVQNRRSGEIESLIFETHKNDVRYHGFHIQNTASDMEMATICPYPSVHHVLLNWIFFYFVVINIQVLSYPVMRQINIQKTHVQQYVLLSTEKCHIVHCMTDVHKKNKNMSIVFHSANNKSKRKVMHKKIACVHGDIHCLL